MRTDKPLKPPDQRYKQNSRYKCFKCPCHIWRHALGQSNSEARTTEAAYHLRGENAYQDTNEQSLSTQVWQNVAKGQFRQVSYGQTGYQEEHHCQHPWLHCLSTTILSQAVCHTE